MRLTLRFASGQVSGEGHDRIGSFTIAGAYFAESANFTKFYPRHPVVYDGRWDGQVLFGKWTIRNRYEGEFELWPEDEETLINGLVEEKPETVGV